MEKESSLHPKQWMLTYLVINFVALWEISRFADNLGLGFSSWIVILLFAAVIDLIQGGAMMILGEKSKKFFA
jgi:predicted membrane protein